MANSFIVTLIVFFILLFVGYLFVEYPHIFLPCFLFSCIWMIVHTVMKDGGWL